MTALHRQNAKIHNGLLQAGQGGKAGDLPDAVQTEPDGFFRLQKRRKFYLGIDRNSNSGDVLREDRGLCGAGYAAV